MLRSARCQSPQSIDPISARVTWINIRGPQRERWISWRHTPRSRGQCLGDDAAFSWRVDRDAAPGRRANCCCAASAHQWAVASPVRREACARHWSRGVRRRGSRIDGQRSRPSLGTGDTSAMAAAKRKPAAKKPAAKKAAKKPAVKKPAAKKCGAVLNPTRRPPHWFPRTGRPRRRPRRRRSPPRSRPRSP